MTEQFRAGVSFLRTRSKGWEQAGLLKEDLGRMGEWAGFAGLRTSVTHRVLSPFDPQYWGERSFLPAEKRQDWP